ncbi:ROK family protein [Clostridium neonatale]|uniref:Sugar kinase of the NBD/HSP70 family, may contain an N-terminal HTH domain n=1 Tax=Clostridium neonatale TaxID=137838 RepID=A0AA86MMR0_9CLOT|nr:ROK family protein [Clostridium neonatale]MBP8314326.1 ROK family protein [Clostridium neonatale]CAG9704262.1 Sugar kinase of the NBD/HSP70 family, may contain an N-terminal HTH domain [Clostridium neonatale]CAI3538669.1 ROK family protein [Clostridium neonatale]CAI3561705.1 ROK family protein [Clostridium neonatale]CAI3564396.1 ROK family protein [Clostridium neonatale]
MKSVNGNSLIIKEVNKNIIRRVLKSEKKATKQRLSELTGLSTVTIGSILQQLLESGEVSEDDLIPSNGGRPAHSFSYNFEYSHVLIIYTHENEIENKDTIYVRVINLFGECIYKEEYIEDNISLTTFEPIIDKLINTYPTIKAIGFGLPGEEYNEVLVVNDYKNLTGQRFSEYYRNKYSIPVIIENDVNSAVIGYCSLHENEIDDNCAIVYIYFPTKYCPGAGIYINGKLYKGFKNFAGEIQNLPIDVNWTNIDFSSFDYSCKAISKLIISITSLLDPKEIVMHGHFLTEKHLINISEICNKHLIGITTPALNISSNFSKDYEQGLNTLTLDLLETKLSLVK